MGGDTEMAVYGDFDHTFKQQENLSTAGAAFMPVYLATNNAVRIASTYTTKAFGILQKVSNSVNTGASVMVKVGSISKAICDSCVAGDFLGAGAEGLRKVTEIIKSTTTDVNVLARALEGSVQTGTVISVLINPFAIPHLTITAGGSASGWISDITTDKIYNVQQAGTLISSFTVGVYDPAATSPTGISAASDGTLWICDNTTDKIYNIQNAGTLISSFTNGVYDAGAVAPRGISM